VRVLKNVIRIYKNAGFNIKRNHGDIEFQLILDQLDANFNIVFNFTGVPEAERNNRVIKKRVRAAFHCLSFVKVPKVMVQVMVMESAKNLNFPLLKVELPYITVQE
jgi:hypothetical protein